MAVGINLALGLKGLPSLSLADILAVIMVAVLLAVDVVGAAVGFLHGLNLLFDAAAAAALADLFDFLSGKLLLIFFLCFSTNCAASKSFLRLLCLATSNGVEIKDFSVSLNFFYALVIWGIGLLPQLKYLMVIFIDRFSRLHYYGVQFLLGLASQHGNSYIVLNFIVKFIHCEFFWVGLDPSI